MSRSSNMKRKRKTRRATGVPCESREPLHPELKSLVREFRAKGVPVEIDRARGVVMSWQEIAATGPGYTMVLSEVN